MESKFYIKGRNWAYHFLRNGVLNYRILFLLSILLLGGVIAGLPLHSFPQKAIKSKFASFQEEQFASLLPFSAQQPIFSALLEAEVEIDDEETHTIAFNKFLNQYFVHRKSAEIAFNSFLRSKLFHLRFSLYKRPTVPFFILHHTWKDYLV